MVNTPSVETQIINFHGSGYLEVGSVPRSAPPPHPVQCPATLTNISELKQKHKDQPGVEFTVKNSKRAKVGRQLDTHKQK